MARFTKEADARANAQTNANDTNILWCVFSDTSGQWNSERFNNRPLASWSGVQVAVVSPKCVECGINHSDMPSRLCAGCEACQAHTS